MLLVYHEVVDPTVCDRLIQEHDSNPDKKVLHQEDASFDGRVLFLHRMAAATQHLTATLTLEIGKVVSRQFQTDLYPETVSIVRWSAGEEMAVHRDGHNEHTSNRTHSVVVYLNEQDEGGEIYFPEMGATISPRRGLMVAYDKTVLHGVRPVKQPRYTLTLWFTEQADRSIIRSE